MTIKVETYGTISDAAAALASNTSARYFGGGTFAMRVINDGQASVATVIRSTDPALGQMASRGTRLEIGAGVTMAQVLGSREADFLHPAAAAVGGPAVRNMATVGGNLFARTPYGDFTTALLALDAVVTLAGARQRQDMPLEQFLAALEQNRDQVVASVTVERPTGLDSFRFLKVSRTNPKRAAIVTMAAHLPQSAGRLQGVRVAYGAMANRPMRATAAERALEGQSLDATAVKAAAAVAAEGTAPATDSLASDWYRREVAPVHLTRLLLGQIG